MEAEARVLSDPVPLSSWTESAPFVHEWGDEVEGSLAA